MTVLLTRPALADLDEIAAWIGRDDENVAEAFVFALREKCAGLTEQPRRYPHLPPPRAHIHKLTYRDYLIFYRVRGADVEILRIIHGARDWASLFEG